MMSVTPTYIILGLAALSIGWSILETLRIRRKFRDERINEED